MINPTHKLSVARQARLLGFSRGSVDDSPRQRPTAIWNDAADRRSAPRLSVRRKSDVAGLPGEGTQVGRLHVATLMKKMGIEAIYRRPNTSKPAPGHKIYPYLLRKLAVTSPDQDSRAMDITYVPMARGFVYLCAVVGTRHQAGSVLAAVDHDGGGLLHRSGRGRAGPLWKA